MKLETKHLAPYLPYNLKCEVLNSGQEKEIGEMIAVYNDGSACFGNIVESEKGFEYIKPILQPLFSEDFDYSIFLMDNFPEEKWADAYNDIMNGVGFGVKIEQIPYELHDFLFENHIDVFGLIEKGLAIDINTLSVQNDG